METRRKQCPGICMDGTPCNGTLVLRNINNPLKKPFLGCENYYKVTLQDTPGNKHFLLPIPDVNIDILRQLIDSKGACQSQEVVSGECKYLLPVRSGGRGEKKCRTLS